VTANVSDPHSAPLFGYALILGAFGAALAATAAARRELRLRPLDYVLLSAATFKAARVVSRERMGMVIREPLLDSDADGRGLHVAPSGLRRAVGELVTCSRCAGTWAAAGLIAAQTAFPRFGRLLTLALSAGAANDLLQAAFARLRSQTTEAAETLDAEPTGTT
jgi:hypothetical protein